MKPITTLAAASVAALILSTVAVAGPSRQVNNALRDASRVYHVSYWQMRSVSWCESRWNPRAVGNGSLGLFQFLPSTWARTPFRRFSVFSAWWNAHAAGWLVRRDGGWGEWSCRPR